MSAASGTWKDMKEKYMEDRKWIEAVKHEINDLKNRVKKLEGMAVCTAHSPEVIELDLTLPEADIDGLHFNEQIVHAVFEKHDDGWYYSRDVLFLSARNIEDDNSQDILMKYLNSYGFIDCIRQQLPEEVFGEVLNPERIEVSLPKETQGIKKYNGVGCWYWLQPRSASAAYFCHASLSGDASYTSAGSVGGCAPAFSFV